MQHEKYGYFKTILMEMHNIFIIKEDHVILIIIIDMGSDKVLH